MFFTFTPEEIRYMLLHIHDDRGPILIGVTCMFLVLCFTATSARFLARRVTRAPIAADDYLVLAALVRDILLGDWRLWDSGLAEGLSVSVHQSFDGVLFMYPALP